MRFTASNLPADDSHCLECIPASVFESAAAYIPAVGTPPPPVPPAELPPAEECGPSKLDLRQMLVTASPKLCASIKMYYQVGASSDSISHARTV